MPLKPSGTAVGRGPGRTESVSLSRCNGGVQWGCGKLKWRGSEPRAIFLIGPEWRNWQTQQTQNLPELCSVWVRLPPSTPTLSKTLQYLTKVRFMRLLLRSVVQRSAGESSENQLFGGLPSTP